MFEPHLLGELEALLFAAGEPINADKIAKVLDIKAEEVPEVITELTQEYESNLHGIQVRKVAGGYQLVTKPSLITVVHRLVEQQEVKLSNAAMETLAIIAFKQPVTRSEMEAIRGVKVDSIVNKLLEDNLIVETGRKDTIGHPILYGTTDLFLTTFGLDSLQDLPEIPEEILTPKEEIEGVAQLADPEAVISDPLFVEPNPEEDKQEEIIKQMESTQITPEAEGTTVEVEATATTEEVPEEHTEETVEETTDNTTEMPDTKDEDK